MTQPNGSSFTFQVSSYCLLALNVRIVREVSPEQELHLTLSFTIITGSSAAYPMHLNSLHYYVEGDHDIINPRYSSVKCQMLYHCYIVEEIRYNYYYYYKKCARLIDHWRLKWNESGFRPHLCTYRLNWARRTSWGWWDDWDDTVLQTQDSKFEPWRSEAEHATSRSRRLPTILTFTRGWGRNIFVSFKPPRPGTEPRTLAWKATVLTTTLGPPTPLRGWMHIMNLKTHIYE